MYDIRENIWIYPPLIYNILQDFIDDFAFISFKFFYNSVFHKASPDSILPIFSALLGNFLNNFNNAYNQLYFIAFSHLKTSWLIDIYDPFPARVRIIQNIS